MAGPRTERPNFWSSLSQVDRTELHRIGHVKRFPANSLVLREDDPSDYVLVLRAGCAKVASDSGIGYQTVLALRDPGDLVGEQASVEGGGRSASVYALTDVEALVVPAPRFTAFRQARPLVERVVQRILSSRLREADRYRTAAGADTVPQRLALLLLDLGRRYGTAGAGGTVVVALPLSQEDLAGLVLTSKRTIGRVLEQWREQGYVATARRAITIRNPAGLEQAANSA